MAIWIVLLFLSLFNHNSLADAGTTFAAIAVPRMAIITGISLGMGMMVVLVVLWCRRKQAPALESGFLGHVEGGAGYKPPPPSAPPMEERDRVPVREDVYGEIVEEDYEMRKR